VSVKMACKILSLSDVEGLNACMEIGRSVPLVKTVFLKSFVYLRGVEPSLSNLTFSRDRVCGDEEMK